MKSELAIINQANLLVTGFFFYLNVSSVIGYGGHKKDFVDMCCYAHFPLYKLFSDISIIAIFIFYKFLKHKTLIVFEGITPSFLCLLR